MPDSNGSMSLPIIDLSPLSSPAPSRATLSSLSSTLSTAFSTTGFAYLTNAPLSFTDNEVFDLAHQFFSLPNESKMGVARKTFRPHNANTYRGYFPVQAGSDNLKEGFEIGPEERLLQNNRMGRSGGFNLNEGNVWPEDFDIAREKLERLHGEMQALSGKLLALLAVALGKSEDCFEEYMQESLSTLRLMHYPAVSSTSQQQELCCTPHTDSGILTLLHQDATGGLEVLSADEKEWIPAPYVPGSIVVNIGDLMSRVSGGKFKATVHRVRSSFGKERFSVPFFFEPGAACLVRSAVEFMDEGEVGEKEGWGVQRREVVVEA